MNRFNEIINILGHARNASVNELIKLVCEHGGEYRITDELGQGIDYRDMHGDWVYPVRLFEDDGDYYYEFEGDDGETYTHSFENLELEEISALVCTIKSVEIMEGAKR